MVALEGPWVIWASPPRLAWGASLPLLSTARASGQVPSKPAGMP